jgi:tetratricopeptide (TPR) repeat protein
VTELRSDIAALTAALSDRYALERELGRGGMATVHLAHDLKHDRPVALKVLHPELAATLGPERFQREIHFAARLQHPHILTVLDSGEAAGRLWFTMPYVEGESLRDRLRRERPLPVPDAVRIVRQAGAALDYAHRQAVVHRDIKPENILLTRDGDALVADFGVARGLSGVGESLTQTGLTLGTPAYMSPEQASGATELDGRSDIYSLGCVAYEMLAGEPPFTGPSPQAVIAKRFSEIPLPLRSRRPDTPEHLGRAVDRALAREPGDRFATAADLVRSLDDSPSPVPGRRRRLGRVAVIIGLLLATGFGARALLTGSGHVGAGSRTTVAVLPFSVRGNPGLAYMREGMVELLSTKLDGAGDLRAVDARALLSAVRGGAAEELGPEDGRGVAARFNAGRFVLGSVLQLGDSLRLSAALYDGDGSRRAGAETVVKETDISRGVDDIARLLLGGMSRTPADRITSLGAVTTASYPALRAYLAGQQAFRGFQLDSAVVAFRHATDLDSTFALAWYRLATAAVWNDQESLWYEAMDQAVRHVDRLSGRDRALVEAQHTWRRGRVIEAERQYQAITAAHPDDQEAWFWLGDVRLHTNFLNGRGIAESETPFRRALTLDPADWQARGHLEWLLRRTGRGAEADSVDTPPDTTGLFMFIRRDAPGAAARREAIFRAADARQMYRLAVQLLQPGFDPASGARAARLLTDPSRPTEWRAHAHLLLGCEQLARGRWIAADSEFAAAERLAPEDGLPYRALFALTSPVPAPDTTLRKLAGRLLAWDAARVPDRHGNKVTVTAALDGQRSVIRRYLLGMFYLRLGNEPAAHAQADTLAATADSGHLGSLAGDYAATIRASAVSTSGDAAAALRALEAQRFVILDYRFIWPFESHGAARLLRASSLTRLGREEEALGWLDGLTTPEFPLLDRQFFRAPAHRLAGEIHERRGDRARALEAYGRFVELWRDGDPAALEQVKAVRERMAALAAEPRT